MENYRIIKNTNAFFSYYTIQKGIYEKSSIFGSKKLNWYSIDYKGQIVFLPFISKVEFTFLWQAKRFVEKLKNKKIGTFII